MKLYISYKTNSNLVIQCKTQFFRLKYAVYFCKIIANISYMSHQKIKCQILQCNVCEMKIRYSYREIIDNNAYSIYNKQKFVCKMFSTVIKKK